MRDTRAITQLLEKYERDRLAFIGSLNEFAKYGEANATFLADSGAHTILQPLLLNDPVPGVRTAAATALGNICRHSYAVTHALIASGAPLTLVSQLLSPSSSDHISTKPRELVSWRKASIFFFRGLSQWEDGAKAVVGAQGLTIANDCLDSPDAELAESAIKLLGIIANTSSDLAGAVVAAGAVPHLVAALGRGRLAAHAAHTLSNIVEHSSDYTEVVAQAGAPALLISLLLGGLDAKAARDVLCVLSHVAKSDATVARDIMESGALEEVARFFTRDDVLARRFAASVLQSVAMHDTELASAVAFTPGCLKDLATYAQEMSTLNALPALMTMGFLCSFDPRLAEMVIASDGCLHIMLSSLSSHLDPVKSAAAWALGQMGKHSPQLAFALAQTGVLPVLNSLATSTESSPDLVAKCSRAAAALAAQLYVPQMSLMSPQISSPALSNMEQGAAGVVSTATFSACTTTNNQETVTTPVCDSPAVAGPEEEDQGRWATPPHTTPQQPAPQATEDQAATTVDAIEREVEEVVTDAVATLSLAGSDGSNGKAPPNREERQTPPAVTVPPA